MITTFRADGTVINDLTLNEVVQKHWQWLLGLGIALVALGTVSILVAALTTIISVIFFGAFLLANGIMLMYQTFKLWWHQWGKFFLQLSMGILYALAGVIFITFPVHGAISLTLMIALFYIAIGLYRAVLATTQKTHGWGWMVFSGVVTAILGVLILLIWPAASLWVIGVFVGIDILFVGWAFIMSALSARGETTVITRA